MIQIRHVRLTLPGATNTSVYYHPLTPVIQVGLWGIATTESTMACPAAGTFRNLTLTLATDPGAGRTQTILFSKGGVDQSLSVTITGGGSLTGSSSNSFTVAAGDSLTLKRSGTGFPVASVGWLTYEWEPDVADTSIYGFGGSQDVFGASTARDGLFDDGSSWDRSADEAATLIGQGGTVTAMRIVLSAAPGASNTRTFTIVKNGVSQDGTGGTPDTRITFGAADTSLSASFSLTVAAWDLVYVQHSQTGTPSNTHKAVGAVAFVSADPNRWHVGTTSEDDYSASATEYHWHEGCTAGAPHWTTTEANSQHIGASRAYFLGGMIARLAVAPGSGKSVAFTLRVSGTNTTQTLTIADTDTESATTGAVAEVPASSALLVDVSSVPSGTPTVASSFPKISFWGTDVESVRGSSIFGEDGTIAGLSHVHLLNLDGVTRTLSDFDSQFAVFADYLRFNVAWVNFIEVALTNAEVKALRATPKTLVAAPGAGKVLEFVSAVLLLDYGGTNVFTETSDNLAVRFQNTTGVIVSEAIETTGFIDQSADTATNAIPKADAIAAKSGCENQPLVLHNTGDGEIAGNAANDNLMRVRLAYRVWSTGW
jgi:hypothetical protein